MPFNGAGAGAGAVSASSAFPCHRRRVRVLHLEPVGGFGIEATPAPTRLR
jgi:hypothetical protein